MHTQFHLAQIRYLWSYRSLGREVPHAFAPYLQDCNWCVGSSNAFMYLARRRTQSQRLAVHRHGDTRAGLDAVLEPGQQEMTRAEGAREGHNAEEGCEDIALPSRHGRVRHEPSRGLEK